MKMVMRENSLFCNHNFRFKTAGWESTEQQAAARYSRHLWDTGNWW